MSNQKIFITNISDIKYCDITIVFNKSDNLLVEMSRFFNWSGENTQIQNSDTIILEYDDKMIEFKSTYQSDNNIIYKYYSFGSSPYIIPKSIIKEVNDKFYLSYIEPTLLNNDYINTHVNDIFAKYPNKISKIPSCYCCAYRNIYDGTIAFGITKINNSNNKSSRYAIGYDKSILNLEEVKSIIKEIFYK